MPVLDRPKPEGGVPDTLFIAEAVWKITLSKLWCVYGTANQGQRTLLLPSSEADD